MTFTTCSFHDAHFAGLRRFRSLGDVTCGSIVYSIARVTWVRRLVLLFCESGIVVLVV